MLTKISKEHYSEEHLSLMSEGRNLFEFRKLNTPLKYYINKNTVYFIHEGEMYSCNSNFIYTCLKHLDSTSIHYGDTYDDVIEGELLTKEKLKFIWHQGKNNKDSFDNIHDVKGTENHKIFKSYENIFYITKETYFKFSNLFIDNLIVNLIKDDFINEKDGFISVTYNAYLGNNKSLINKLEVIKEGNLVIFSTGWKFNIVNRRFFDCTVLIEYDKFEISNAGDLKHCREVKVGELPLRVHKSKGKFNRSGDDYLDGKVFSYLPESPLRVEYLNEFNKFHKSYLDDYRFSLNGNEVGEKSIELTQYPIILILDDGDSFLRVL